MAILFDRAINQQKNLPGGHVAKKADELFWHIYIWYGVYIHSIVDNIE